MNLNEFGNILISQIRIKLKYTFTKLVFFYLYTKYASNCNISNLNGSHKKFTNTKYLLLNMARRKKCLLVPINVCEIDKTVEWDYDKTAEEILTQFLVCFLRKQTILERKLWQKKANFFSHFLCFVLSVGAVP